MTEKNFLKRVLNLLRPENIPLLDKCSEEIVMSEKPRIAACWWESVNEGVHILSFAYQKLDKCYGLYEDVIAFNVKIQCALFTTTMSIQDKHGKVFIEDTPAQRLFDKMVIKIVKEEINKRLLEIEKGEQK